MRKYLISLSDGTELVLVESEAVALSALITDCVAKNRNTSIENDVATQNEQSFHDLVRKHNRNVASTRIITIHQV